MTTWAVRNVDQRFLQGSSSSKEVGRHEDRLAIIQDTFYLVESNRPMNSPGLVMGQTGTKSRSDGGGEFACMIDYPQHRAVWYSRGYFPPLRPNRIVLCEEWGAPISYELSSLCSNHRWMSLQVACNLSPFWARPFGFPDTFPLSITACWGAQ